MNQQAKLIRYWCMRQPRGCSFVVYTGNEKQTVETGPRTSWARVAETLEAMDAERIDALSVNGNIIRSCKPAELGDDEEAEGEGEKPTEDAPLVNVDAETARLQLVIHAINHAHDSAQEKVGLRNGEVFDRMIDLFETVKALVIDQSKVVQTQNSTIEKLQAEQIRAALERANAGEGGDTWLDNLVKPFFEGMQNAGGDEGEDEPEEPKAAPAAAPNGKGPH